MTQFQDDQNPLAPQDASGAPEMASEEELAFVAPAQASPNRGAILLLLGLVLIGGAGLYLMRLRTGPQAVQASAESSKAKSTILEFIGDNGKGLDEMRTTLKNTQKMVDQFVNESQDNQVPVEDLKTNPFQLRPNAKPEDPDAEKNREAAEAAAAEAARKAHEQAEIKKGAAALRIESILLGGKQRICMINNSSYTQGQEVEGFKIEAIEKGYIVVSKGTYRLKISMQER